MRPKGCSSNITEQLYINRETDEPKNRDEWLEQWADLVKRKKDIETWLAQANIKSADGKRMNDIGYNQRRDELLKKKTEVENKLTDLKKIKSKLFDQLNNSIADILNEILIVAKDIKTLLEIKSKINAG